MPNVAIRWLVLLHVVASAGVLAVFAVCPIDFLSAVWISMRDSCVAADWVSRGTIASEIYRPAAISLS